jgi:hypothetical protein
LAPVGEGVSFCFRLGGAMSLYHAVGILLFIIVLILLFRFLGVV